MCVYIHTHTYTYTYIGIYIYTYMYVCVCVCVCVNIYVGLPMTQMVKNLPVMQETWVRSLGWEDPLENGMAAHFNFIAWRIL